MSPSARAPQEYQLSRDASFTLSLQCIATEALSRIFSEHAPVLTGHDDAEDEAEEEVDVSAVLDAAARGEGALASLGYTLSSGTSRDTRGGDASGGRGDPWDD